MCLDTVPEPPRPGNDAGLESTVDKLLTERSVLDGLGVLSREEIVLLRPIPVPYCALSGRRRGLGGTGGPL